MNRHTLTYRTKAGFAVEHYDNRADAEAAGRAAIERGAFRLWLWVPNTRFRDKLRNGEWVRTQSITKLPHYIRFARMKDQANG